MKKLRLLAATCALVVPDVVLAQVLITEVVPDAVTDESAEWIEIHNTGTGVVSIEGWRIHDFGPSTPTQYGFPTGTSLAPNQVIIVTRQAVAFNIEAVAEGYAQTVADFELALGDDDLGVANLDVVVPGTGDLAMNNSGDALELLDASGLMVIDAVEWGSDRIEVAGSPAQDTSAGQSLQRVNTGGDSSTNFAVIAPPTPGVGFSGSTPIPPTISTLTRTPGTFVFGDTITIAATITDADGIASAQTYFTIATDLTSAAGASYEALTMSAVGNDYSVSGTVNNLHTNIAFAHPTSFHDRYLRYYYQASDLTASVGVNPNGAGPSAGNTHYHWENILPQNTSFTVAEARTQDASEVPVWNYHSVRIEGIALTSTEGFLRNVTNFFIASDISTDAIRIYDPTLITTSVAEGDRVRVTGRIGVYRGVRQVGTDERSNGPTGPEPEVQVQVIGSGVPPLVTTNIAQLLANGEQYESQLVYIPSVWLSAPAPTWPADTTVNVEDGTGTLPVRIFGATTLANMPAPSGTFDIRGILSQYATNGTGDYQLQPRSVSDVIGGGPPIDAGFNPDATTHDAGNLDYGSIDFGFYDSGVRDFGSLDVWDGGFVWPDATPQQDTGFTNDAAPVWDSGIIPDSGRIPVDSGRSSTTGGSAARNDRCSCNATDETNLWRLLPLLFR